MKGCVLMWLFFTPGQLIEARRRPGLLIVEEGLFSLSIPLLNWNVLGDLMWFHDLLQQRGRPMSTAAGHEHPLAWAGCDPCPSWGPCAMPSKARPAAPREDLQVPGRWEGRKGCVVKPEVGQRHLPLWSLQLSLPCVLKVCHCCLQWLAPVALISPYKQVSCRKQRN